MWYATRKRCFSDQLSGSADPEEESILKEALVENELFLDLICHTPSMSAMMASV